MESLAHTMLPLSNKLRSMTGYGSYDLESEQFSIKAEIKSLNGKFLDVSFRCPKFLQSEELKYRNLLNPFLVRGTVNVNISVQSKGLEMHYGINEGVFIQYFNQIHQLSNQLNMTATDIVGHILGLPEVIASQEQKPDEGLLQSVQDTLEKAFAHFDEFRCSEGANLRNLLANYCTHIHDLLPKISPFESERIDKLKERIQKGLASLSEKDYDQNRLEQELIFYIEKFDISEEKERLLHHCNYFIDTLDGEPNGKKLGFICQEMGREINTLGSKANHSEIQKVVVEMKDILEKMKEQILNVL